VPSAERELIEPIVKGGWYHGGQVCVSIQRIFVHETIAAEFTERLIARVKKLRVGDPTMKETEVGPLIIAKEADRVLAWVNEAIAAGAKLATGGGRLSKTTLEPTVLQQKMIVLKRKG
jgi:acyl-CoA reductase-like NAD-dependent aldehyde dehydrogenase